MSHTATSKRRIERIERRDDSGRDGLPRRSDWFFRGFRRYARRYAARRFHAIRVARAGTPRLDQLSGPLIVVMNHPSWWDPLIGLILTEQFPANRVHYAPIEAAGLAQYRFLERLGFFGIETGTSQGGRTFLRRGLAILNQPESVLWITGQGHFVDPRDRPVVLKPGIGHLARLAKGGTILPLAIEYPFWNDRCPEVLARWGSPLSINAANPLTAREWTSAVETTLEQTQDELAAQAMRRDAGEFETITDGSAGVGLVYDAWRRFHAWLRGESFDAQHQVGKPS